jgi:hypothetical protein
MYFESRGSAGRPTVICSAVSDDLLHWKHEGGIRLEGFGGVGGPRFLSLPDGRGRVYCFASEFDNGGIETGERVSQSIVSAVTADGLSFSIEPGYRMRDHQADHDTAGITAAEVIPPRGNDDEWIMFFSAWQDVPAGTEVPLHPSRDPDAANTELSKDFAAASIASDMAGYRSRIFSSGSGPVASSRVMDTTAMNWMRYTLRICRWSKSETVSIACTTPRAIATGTGELRAPFPKRVVFSSANVAPPQMVSSSHGDTAPSRDSDSESVRILAEPAS